jgi:hypothetical protein
MIPDKNSRQADNVSMRLTHFVFFENQDLNFEKIADMMLPVMRQDEIGTRKTDRRQGNSNARVLFPVIISTNVNPTPMTNVPSRMMKSLFLFLTIYKAIKIRST